MALPSTLACLASAAAALALNTAQAQVQIYGTVDVGIGRMANQDPAAHPGRRAAWQRPWHDEPLAVHRLDARADPDLVGR